MLQRHSVLIFYLLSLGLSCLFIFLGYIVFPGALGLVWIGMFGPAASAILMTARIDGRAGIERLLRRLFQWRAPVWVYLFILGMPLAWLIITYFLYPLIGDTSRDAPLVNLAGWLATFPTRLPLLFGMALLYAVMATGEEIGWRGFAQPRLEGRWGALRASLGVGILWGLWHVPAAIDAASVLRRASLWYSIPLFTLSTILFSVIYTWLMYHSRGSLLVVCLFHGWYDILNSYTSLFFPFFINQYGIYNLGVGLVAILLAAYARPFAGVERSDQLVQPGEV
jgi:uncharacterized protein